MLQPIGGIVNYKYEIRFYYKNKDDKHCKKEVVFHSYNMYHTLQEAMSEMKWLVGFYTEIGEKSTVFSYNFPEKLIDPYVLFLDNKNKQLATIIKLN